jgi:cell division septal protein FtsQ
LAVEGQKKSSRQMTRAERQALAEQREAERARAEKMQRFKSSTLPLIVMVAVGLLLAVVVPRVLSWVDAILRG